jgi:hypothetical protein
VIRYRISWTISATRSPRELPGFPARLKGTLRAGGNPGRTKLSKLTTAKKNSEPSKEFGLPEQRKYPMPDASHARNAKARASQMEHQGKLSASDKKKIDTKADKVLSK